MNKGKVYLVGGGPGDPELLTIKAQRLLAQCEVLVYDRLINIALLEHSPQAEMIFVGKEQGRHPAPQEAINKILLDRAQEGKIVVRLKGGDPYLFGRGSEERDYLHSFGIDCEVVPGVTSAIAAPAYAGIPVTARGVSGSVHIVTGHTRGNKELEANYAALAKAGGTLVFMMAVSTCEIITKGLMQEGLPKDTPAAFIENGTLKTQRIVYGALETISQIAQDAGISSPAILVIGEVCNLHL